MTLIEKDIIKTVRKIELKTRSYSEGFIQGFYRSKFKGSGIEFSDYRKYSFGDDIRNIDWNVTARMNKPYVREFVEERDMTVYILLDVSGSFDFGSKKNIKREIAAEISATLAFAAVHNNDRVGLILFSDKVEHIIPPKRGRKNVLHMIKDILSFNSVNKTTDMSSALKYINNITKRKSIIFVISDFMNLPQNLDKYLKIVSRKHDLISIRVMDEREIDIPDVGMIYLEDMETGEQVLVDTSNPEFYEDYHRLVELDLEYIRKKIILSGSDYIGIQNGSEWFKSLSGFFKSRIPKNIRNVC
ncbi:MAG: DUF58 domain-containing protein [DPANN group archaeon]|nr:DUF58 domain-containing protein [DPANN group archaeon]